MVREQKERKAESLLYDSALCSRAEHIFKFAECVPIGPHGRIFNLHFGQIHQVALFHGFPRSNPPLFN